MNGVIRATSRLTNIWLACQLARSKSKSKSRSPENKKTLNFLRSLRLRLGIPQAHPRPRQAHITHPTAWAWGGGARSAGGVLGAVLAPKHLVQAGSTHRLRPHSKCSGVQHEASPRPPAACLPTKSAAADARCTIIRAGLRRIAVYYIKLLTSFDGWWISIKNPGVG